MVTSWPGQDEMDLSEVKKHLKENDDGVRTCTSNDEIVITKPSTPRKQPQLCDLAEYQNNAPNLAGAYDK